MPVDWFFNLTITGSLLLLIAEVAFQVVVLGAIVARGRTAPAVRLAWLLVVFLLPVAGPLLYLRLGRVPMEGRVKRRRATRERIATLLTSRGPRPQIEFASTALGKMDRLIQALGGYSSTDGNRLRLFGESVVTTDPTAAMVALVADLDAARSSCHLLFYIYLDDESGRAVAEALIRAVERGVACRLLVDAVGSRPFLASPLRRRLEQGGVEVAEALPVTALRALFGRFDFRNHRKIVVIDGTVGWTGSQNVANASFAPKARYAPWVDVMVRIEGPAVFDLQRLFVEDWLADARGSVEALLTPVPGPLDGGVPVQMLASGPATGSARAMTEASLLGFLEVDEELILTTPYFVPDEATATALATTARSGVHVVLVVPQRNDSRLVAAASRSYYEALLDAGVEIYEYPHGLLHAKTATFDGVASAVATANLDRRSFELNYEISLVVTCPDFTGSLRELQHGYVAASRRIDPQEWCARPTHRRLLENAAGLLAPLL